MKKYLFEEIIEVKKISLVISANAKDDKDKKYLTELAKSTINHKVLDLILDELDPDKKQNFIKKYYDELGNTGVADIIKDLKKWITDFEKKVEKKVIEAEEELVQLINLKDF
jgi:hypothetical protein